MPSSKATDVTIIFTGKRKDGMLPVRILRRDRQQKYVCQSLALPHPRTEFKQGGHSQEIQKIDREGSSF